MQSLGEALRRATDEASVAKGAWDKAKQKEAGLIIRRLKEELQEYGEEGICR